MSSRQYLQWTDPAAAEALVALAVDGEPLAWQDEAVCATADPEIWHPEKGGSTKEAKKICRGCPVRHPCLQYAMETGQRFGIWGGLSERERRLLSRSDRGVIAA